MQNCKDAIKYELPSIWTPNGNGDYLILNRDLTSLRGAPRVIDGCFDVAMNSLTSLEYAPEYVNGIHGFGCGTNHIASLHNVHKIFKRVCGPFWFSRQKTNKLVTNILGLCWIEDLPSIRSGNSRVDQLFLEHKHDVILFQEALIDAGFIDQAKF